MKELLERAQRTYPVRLAMTYGNSQASNYASVVAFNAFMTMFPLILGVLAILGYVVRNDALEAQVQHQIVAFFPTSGDQTRALTDALAGVKHNAGVLGIVSVLGLLYTGTNFFSSLEFALDEVYGLRVRGFLPQRIMGAIMLVAFVAALLVSVAANALVALLNFVPFLGIVVGALAMIGLLLLIYWVVPNRKQRWRDVWAGSVVGGVLIEVLTLAWPLYTKVAHNFNTYGSTFALFFLLATWLYFLSQLILLGAVVNRMRSGAVPGPEQAAARAVDQHAQGGRVKLERRRRPDVQA